MSSPIKEPLFAVLRVDWFQFEAHRQRGEKLTAEDVSELVAITKVVDDESEALAEVSRLNEVQADKGVESSYFVLHTRGKREP
jgi:hypothetical protein